MYETINITLEPKFRIRFRYVKLPTNDSEYESFLKVYYDIIEQEFITTRLLVQLLRYLRRVDDNLLSLLCKSDLQFLKTKLVQQVNDLKKKGFNVQHLTKDEILDQISKLSRDEKVYIYTTYKKIYNSDTFKYKYLKEIYENISF